VGMYDTIRPVVIDPVLVYSTYLGGGGTDQSVSIAVDSSANAYVTGFTFSTNFPTTPGAFQTTLGGADAFVTKLNATGTALVYSTYLGGSGGEEGFSLTVDSSGNAYVTGGTSSVNFPTTPGAFQTTFHGGGVDAFVTKLNATGSALVYSTYLGANGGDEAFGIALDSARNAYVTGETNSITFPTTPGAFQTLSPGSFFRNDDAFVTKINSTGTALIYSTYLGGSRADDGGRGIIVDPSGNAYVTGFTFSTNFPTKGAGFSLAFQRTLGGGADTFVTKVNATGSALVYSTYLGGGGNDESFGIALDSARNAYVTGFTFSTNFPTTPGAFQTTLGGGADAFVTKLNFLGSALFYSTYLGGNQDENFIFGFSQEGSITVDSSGNAYVTGDTTSLNFPTTRAVQTTLGGSLDAFVTKLSFSGDALIFSTFLGGSVGDVGIGIALDSSNENDVYVTGRTFSGNFPTTPGAFQTTFSGGFGDAFVTKIDTSLFIPGLTGFWQDLNQSCGGSEGHVKCLLKGTFVVQNPGTATASNSVLRFVLSEDATFDESDTLLQEVAVGALKAGETKTRQLNVALPDGRSASGQFVIAVVDADNDVPEANEANNIVVSPPIP